MASFEDLLVHQDQSIQSIQRSLSNVKNFGQFNWTAAVIKRRTAHLDAEFSECKNLNLQLRIKAYDSKQTNHPYFANQLFTRCVEMHDEASRLLADALKIAETNCHRSTPEVQTGMQSSTRLPQFDLPQLDKKVADWTSLLDQFSTLVHHDTSLTNVEQESYLCSGLRGDALESVNHLPITDINCDSSRNILRSRFDSARQSVLEPVHMCLDHPKLPTLLCTQHHHKECTLSDEIIETGFSSEKVTKSDRTQNQEEHPLDCNERQTISNDHHVETVHELSTNVAVPSLSFHEDIYNVQLDANTNLQATSSGHDSLHENAYQPNVLNRTTEENISTFVLADNQSLLASSSDIVLPSLSEDQQHRRPTSFARIEQLNTDYETKFHRKISIVEPESVSTALIPTSKQSSCSTATFSAQNYGTTYHGLTNHTVNTRFVKFNSSLFHDLSESFPAMNRSIAEIPLKHPRVGLRHPTQGVLLNPPVGTPQNRLLGYSNKTRILTSLTILSSWCHPIRRQPIGAKSQVTKDAFLVFWNAGFLPIMGRREASLFFEVASTSAKRLLTDFDLPTRDPLKWSLETRPSLLLQTYPEIQCGSSAMQPDEQGWKTRESSDIKSTPIETKSVHEMKLVNLLERTRKNKQPDRPTSMFRSDEPITPANAQLPVDSNTILQVVQDSARRFTIGDVIRPNTERKRSLNRQKQLEGLLQLRNRVMSAQFSVPSLLSRQRLRRARLLTNNECSILSVLCLGLSGKQLPMLKLSCSELRAIPHADMIRIAEESALGCSDDTSSLPSLPAPCVIRVFADRHRESRVYAIRELSDICLNRSVTSRSHNTQISLTIVLCRCTDMITPSNLIHGKRVVHSNLLPAQFLGILVRLHLIDFEMAPNLNPDIPSVSQINPIGPFKYISPKALKDIGGDADSLTSHFNSEISFKSDMWSLGHIVYDRVNGQTHFHQTRSPWTQVHPSETIRRLYVHVLHSMMLYAAPVWAHSFSSCKSYRVPLLRVQRNMALRVISAYRTVSYEAAMLLARIPPLYLLANRQARIHERMKDINTYEALLGTSYREVRDMAELIMLRQWKASLDNPDLPGARVRDVVLPSFYSWINRKHGTLNYFLTQLITGHGSFGSYLYRFNKLDNPACPHCDNNNDSSDHTMEECPMWQRQREALYLDVGRNISWSFLIPRMLSDKVIWNAVSKFSLEVMSLKERLERERQAHARRILRISQDFSSDTS